MKDKNIFNPTINIIIKQKRKTIEICYKLLTKYFKIAIIFKKKILTIISLKVSQ